MLPASAIQIYDQFQLRRDRQAQVHAEARRLAELVARELNGLLAGAHILLTTLARTPAIEDGDAAACNRLLAGLGREVAGYVGLGAIGLDGSARCSTAGPSLRGDTLGLAAAYAAGGLHVGRMAPAAGEPALLPVTLPFEDRTGRVAGLVGVNFDLARLGRQLAARPMPPGTCLGIMDRDGVLLLRIPDGDGVGERIGPHFRWLLRATAPGTVAGLGMDGVERIFGYVPPAATAGRALLIGVGVSTQVRPALGSGQPHGAACCWSRWAERWR